MDRKWYNIVHVLDQDGNPVEGVTVNFCTDVSCVPKESDEDGLITFTGAPDAYHVTVVDAPDGYSWDEDYEMYTARVYASGFCVSGKINRCRQKRTAMTREA